MHMSVLLLLVRSVSAAHQVFVVSVAACGAYDCLGS